MKKSVLLLLFAAGLIVGLGVGYGVSRAFPAKSSGMEALTADDSQLAVEVMYDGASILPTGADGEAIRPVSVGGVIYVPAEAVERLGFILGYNEGSGILYYTRDEEYATSPLDLPVYYAADEIPVTELPEVQRSTLYLGPGMYVVGEDVPAGKYDVTARSGSGNFMGTVAALPLHSLNEILSATPGTYETMSYSGLRLADGDSFEVKGDLQIRLDPVD